MAQNFIGCDRDQVLLLPPDLGEWLPDGHLARFVLATVEQLDLGVFYGYYRWDGRGRPAHDPAMMVSLVVYAYAVGVTSSRAIERRCVDDLAFRFIAANRRPDHATIARFLIRHRAALSELFFGVLALCARAGMVRVGTVAVDSTKLAANASADQNRTLEGLRAEAQRIIEEAIETDRREDELYGEKRGDELPEELADPRTRAARIKELLEQAEREREQAQAERDALLAADQARQAQSGKRQPGRPVKPGPTSRQQQRLWAKKYNVTDPDSRIVHHRGMLMQGYGIQTAVNEHQVILAARPGESSVDSGQLRATIELAQRNLAQVGVADPVEEILADSGYWNVGEVNALQQAGIRVLIPPINRAKDRQREGTTTHQMRELIESDDGQQRYRKRQQMIEPVFAQIKHNRGITRLLHRGRTAIQGEIDLIATTHNLLKLFHTAPAAA